MAINYARQFNRRITPQSQPIPGSTQVRNSGGGCSWQVDDWTRLDRFLILGAEGGTFYITEQDLVKQNHDAIVRCIKADGVRAVNRIVEISDAGRAPKNDPAIFALALAVTHSDAQAKAHAFANLIRSAASARTCSTSPNTSMRCAAGAAVCATPLATGMWTAMPAISRAMRSSISSAMVGRTATSSASLTQGSVAAARGDLSLDARWPVP